MRVSAIITTCERPVEAASALESVLKQTRAPDELIVVDDGPRCPFEVDESTGGRNNVRILRTAGYRGPSASRNIGAKAATGDVLMFLDDDDTWEPGKVELQCSLFDDDVVLVYTGRLAVDASDRATVKYHMPARRSGHLFHEMLTRNLVGTTSCAAVRAETFWQVGGFDEQQPALNDYELWIRLARMGRIVGDQAFNTRYTLPRSGLVSISSGPSQRHAKAVERLREKYASDYEKLPALLRRKFRANQSFSIAKNARLRSWSEALPHALRAFANYPHPRYLLVLAPLGLREGARRIISFRGHRPS